MQDKYHYDNDNNYEYDYEALSFLIVSYVKE